MHVLLKYSSISVSFSRVEAFLKTEPAICSMVAAVKLLLKLGHICVYKVTIDDRYSVCVCTYYRCEIESTLERLRKLERELYSKEKELEERERRLRLWEERLMERSNMTPSPTSLLMERSNISPVSRSGANRFRPLKTKSNNTFL